MEVNVGKHDSAEFIDKEFLNNIYIEEEEKTDEENKNIPDLELYESIKEQFIQRN